MKKITKLTLMSLIALKLNSEEILQFKKDKIKELNKNFTSSLEFLKDKNRERIEDRESKIALYNQKSKELEDKKNPSKEEKNDLIALQESIQNFITIQEEEARKEYVVFEEELDSNIKRVLPKFTKGIVLESTNIIYGGKDITKELLESLDGKEINKIESKTNLKICSFNFDKILELNQAKDIENYITKERDELSKLQKEMTAKKDQKDFDLESSQRILENKNKEIQLAIQLKQEKLLKSIEDTVEKISIEDKIDIVLDSKITYTSVKDITDRVIKELNTSKSNLKKDNVNNKKIGFISYETIASRYNKNEEKIKEFNQKNIDIEKILEDKFNKIQSMKDKGNKKEDIDKSIEDLENTRNIKFNELMKMRQNLVDNVNNDIKNAARIVAKKNGLTIMFMKQRRKPEILYAGRDFTKEVVDILSNK